MCFGIDFCLSFFIWKFILYDRYSCIVKQKHIYRIEDTLTLEQSVIEAIYYESGDYVKERLLKLLTVKSFVTLILTVVFAILSLNGTLTAEQFMTIFTTAIAFYFGTQSVKKE